MSIDHVIYATGDLDAAETRFRDEFDLPTVPGGRHEGLGTHNRIVPLANGYIELLAIADAEEAAASPLAAAVLDALEHGDRLAGWVVAVEDVEPVAARLQTSIIEVRREGMTGRVTGLAEALAEPWLPFFIERRPDQAPPDVPRPDVGIEWIELAGDEQRLRAWLGGAEPSLRLVDGEPGLRAVGIGGRELRSA